MAFKLKFFTYMQNKSGGFFEVDPKQGIGEVVIIQAASPSEADGIAQRIGLYFGGVAAGIDCGCCGDRWSEQWRDDAGSDRPEIYGEPADSGKSLFRKDVYVHYYDGRFELVKQKAAKLKS
jgi:hypothetical protein